MGGVILFLAISAMGCNESQIRTEIKALAPLVTGAAKDVKARFAERGQSLGLNWLGNLSRLGPKCDEVALEFSDLMAEQMKNSKFDCVGLATVFDPGKLPSDLGAHIFFAVVKKSSAFPNDSDSSRLLYFVDPWRYGDGRLRSIKNCPNSFTEITELK